MRELLVRLWHDERWQTRALLALAVAMALVHVIGILWTSGSRGAFVQGDARAYFAYLPSLVFDHDLDLRNQFAVLQPEGATEYPYGVGFRGRAQNPFPVAPALMWLPGYVVGVGLDHLVDSLPAAQPTRGYGPGAMLLTATWSILLMALAAETTRRLARECVGVPEAFSATLMAWLGTPALYYTVISPLYSHAPAWVAVSLMLWLTWNAARRPGRVGLWVGAGFAAGWVIAVRLQDAPLLVVPLVVLWGPFTSGSPLAAVGRAFAWLSAAVFAYMIQGATSYWLHGSWVPFGGEVGITAPTVTNLMGVLFSVGYRGWISWTPIVLPALAGLVLLAVRGTSPLSRRFAAAAIFGVIGLVAIDVTHPFGAGAAFGGRRYVSLTPFVAVGLASTLGELVGPRWRAVARIGLPALTAWNLWLLLSYELLVIRHGLYPTLLEATRYALGLGAR